MKSLTFCSRCKKDTIHIVVDSKVVYRNYHVRFKCCSCDEPPFTQIGDKDNIKLEMIHKSLNKNTS